MIFLKYIKKYTIKSKFSTFGCYRYNFYWISSSENVNFDIIKTILCNKNSITFVMSSLIFID